ncbi:MAG: hypothetical protein KA586_06340 [Candidatus Promineofilum sp.]|nr:hypothetical protein [Promineifilum sp.]
MKNYFRNADGEINIPIVVALIGASATLLTALIAGVFGLIQFQASRAESPTPPAASLTVEIDGPAEVPLNTQKGFTIISENAVRAEWTITGFGQDEINPFRQSDEVWVEPTDAGRVGDSFTLVVTVYDTAGNKSSARHQFTVVAEE